MDRFDRNPQEVCVCIPVRYASTRLPGKPLLSIGGKPMIIRTIEQALKSRYVNLSNLYIFTDDKRIEGVILAVYSECNVVHTSGKECPNAIYRLSYFEKWLPNQCRAVINLHGDEPFLDPLMLDNLFDEYYRIVDQQSSLMPVPALIYYRPITGNEAQDRSIVKLVKNAHNYALYFSRAMIPHTKSGDPSERISYCGVVGLHLLGRGCLKKYGATDDTELDALYLAEDIEELRLLEMGERIKCLQSPVLETERSLNTREDYEYLVSKYGE